MLFTYWYTPQDSANPYRGDSEEILAGTLTDWRSIFPNFRIFADIDVEPLLNEINPTYLPIYRRIRIPACRADIARLVLLRGFGGMYLDPHVGTASVERLLEVIERLSEKELILFDKRDSVNAPEDRHIVNFALIARRGSMLLKALIAGAFVNLEQHESNESSSMNHVPYNVFTLTGPYNINLTLFDRIGDGLYPKAEIACALHIDSLDPKVQPWPIQPYKHYGYRKPNQHWSERQKVERLFEPRDVEARGDLDASSISGPQSGSPIRKEYNMLPVKHEEQNGELAFHDALRQGDELNHSGKFADCINLLEPFCEQNSHHHWLNFHLGRAHSGLNKYAEAVKYFCVAAASSYPYRVGAFYEIARLDMSVGRLDRAHLLDEALALPGDVNDRNEGSGQKRFYYDRIYFLKALVCLHSNNPTEANSWLERAYAFNRAIDERPFAFSWLVNVLAQTEFSADLVNVRYLKQRFLRTDMTKGLSYPQALNQLPHGAKALEIGAMDGVRFDPLHSYLRDGLFDAVVVEPLADMFALLSKTYNDCTNVICANVAITERTGPLHLYRVRPDEIAKHNLGEWVHGITSAVKGPVLSYLGDLVSDEVVDGLSFDDFVIKFRLRNFDVLQIDTEGFDWNILKQIDLKKYDVRVAQVEIINLMPCDRLEVFSFFRDAGYLFDCEFGEVVAVSSTFSSV
jgi:FkbM family methyltransferase